MTLQFPVGDMRSEAGFGATSVSETAPFGPMPGGGGGFSPRLVLAFPGITANLVAPFDGYLRLVAAPGDAPGAPSIIEIQPIVGAASVALADGLDRLSGQDPPTTARLLPRVRLHGVDPGLVTAALAPLVSDQVTATDPTQPAAPEFVRGAFGVVVLAGSTITPGISGVEIEVTTSDGVPVDPVAYYSYYVQLAPAPGELLADRDWCEELFSRLTRRALVQVVDAHGRPWAESVRVIDGVGATDDVDVSTTGGMLATVLFPPAGGTEVQVASIELVEPGPEAGAQSAERYLLTSEWPAGDPEPVGAIPLPPPDRPAMRRFVVTDLRRWFASQHVTDPGVRLPRYTLGNQVIALVDGLATYRLILQDLNAAIAPGAFYYLTAWAIDPDVPLDGTSPETALTALLRDLAAQGGGAHARVIVWDTFHTESDELQATVAAAYTLAVLLLIGGAVLIPPAGLIITLLLLAGHAVWATDSVDPIIEALVAKLLGDNAGARDALVAAGAEVLFDGKVRQTRSDAAPRLYDFVGSHHQKFTVISGPAGVVAYCGGIDMRNNRLEDARHLDASPYHDLHCRVAGPAAADLAITFRQRWDDQPGPGRSLAAGDGALVAVAPAGSTHAVQVARTYPNGLDLADNAYSFASDGDFTIRATIIKAVALARRYIYIEDQYLTPPDDLADLLVQRMTDVPELQLVMTIPRGSDQPENNSRRATFIGRLLKDFGPERVIVLFPTRLAFPPDRERHGPAVSQLAEPITAAALELPVDDASVFAESGTVLIDTEEISYSSRDMPGRKLVVGAAGRRGHNNTQADHHTDRSRVSQITARDIFVHSKLWIIDDLFVSIGSANVNNRGMNHDSEANVFVVDGRSDRSARRFAKQLRVDLWAEHLGLGESTAARMLLDDPDRALAFLVERPGPAGNRLRRYWALWNSDHKTESWGSLLEPGLYWDVFQTIEGPLLDDTLWLTYIDPDGSEPLT